MAKPIPAGIAIPHLLWLALFCLAPLGFMLRISFATPEAITAFSAELSLANYARQLETPYPGLFVQSLGLAATTALSCVALALPLALALLRLAPRLRLVMLLAICLPFWISAVVRTYALQEILGRNGLINSALRSCWEALAALFPGIGAYEPLPLLYSQAGVVIGLIYAFVPFALLPIYASLSLIDPSLREASRDLGAGALATFSRITLPLALPGIAAALFLVFIPTLGAFYVAEMLGGPSEVFFGNLLKLQFYEANNWPFGAALSVALLVAAVAALLLLRPRLRASLS